MHFKGDSVMLVNIVYNVAIYTRSCSYKLTVSVGKFT